MLVKVVTSLSGGSWDTGAPSIARGRGPHHLIIQKHQLIELSVIACWGMVDAVTADDGHLPSVRIEQIMNPDQENTAHSVTTVPNPKR